MLQNTLSIPHGSTRAISLADSYYLFNPDSLRVYEADKKVLPKDVIDGCRHYVEKTDLPLKLVQHFQHVFPSEPCFDRGTELQEKFYVIVFLTDTCNLRCVYCYQQDFIKTEGMTSKTADHLVSWILSHDQPKNCDVPLHVIFFGGEPLLNRKSLDQVASSISEQTKYLRPSFFISTNGTLLDEQNADLLAKHNVRMQVSIDGYKEVQDKNRPLANGSGSYDLVCSNLRHPSIDISSLTGRITVTKHSLDFYENAVHLYNLGFRQIAVGFCVHGGAGNEICEEDMPSIRRNLQKLWTFYLARISEGDSLKITPFYDHLLLLSLRQPPPSCGAGRNVFAINSDGDILPCPRFSGGEMYSCGNVRTQMDKKRVRDIQSLPSFSLKKPKECRSCWVRNLCSAPCRFFSSPGPQQEAQSTLCSIIEIQWETCLSAFITARQCGISIVNTILKTAEDRAS